MLCCLRSVPAFMGLTGYLALGGLAALFRLRGVLSSDTNRYLKSTLQVIYWFVYVGSFALLVIHARWWPSWGIKKPHNVLNWLWNTRVVVNACIMFLNAFVLTALVVTSFVAESSLSEMSPREHRISPFCLCVHRLL